ncbi:MAG: hypothetical protein WC856_02540 [Methylococcaceae bacterium]|jgi:hypothetical protein
MSVTYATATKTGRLNAVITAIGASGKLELGTAGMAAVLATITLDATAGTATTNVLSLSGFPKTVAASGTGTLAAARIRTSADADVITGLTVGTSGTDIIVDNTSLVTGQNVTVNATPTITHN